MGTALSKPQAENRRDYADGFAALRATTDGYSSQTIAKWLMEEGYWPKGPVATAAAKVRACQNPEKDAHFRFSELIFICQKTGQPDAIYFACDELGLERPAPLNNPRAAADMMEAAIRIKERELEDLQARRRVLRVKADQEIFPSPKGIRRLRFSLHRWIG